MVQSIDRETKGIEFHSHTGPHLGEIQCVHISTLLTISPLMSASHLFMTAPSNMCYMRIQSPRDFIFQAGIWYCETTTMDLLVVLHYPVRNSMQSLYKNSKNKRCLR